MQCIGHRPASCDTGGFPLAGVTNSAQKPGLINHPHQSDRYSENTGMDEPRGRIEIFPPGSDDPVPEPESSSERFRRRAKAVGLTVLALVALVSELVPVLITTLSYIRP